MTKQVYAMKVIRKSEMLRSNQEGHLRAERDFLVASEGSNWIVPLVAAFQDVSCLYLVMEYMAGGDFLSLLIRENTLDEPVARFYVAEMILCVEEAHALRCIHRDIKPDNFLISASGHLKISDFGLAFDGHWSHDGGYYTSARYSLLRRLGIYVEGDEQDKKKTETKHGPRSMIDSNMLEGMDRYERPPHGDQSEPVLQWRNRYGNHTAATSIVGTSQYMAPEVVKGEKYTPFLAEEGRQQTKRNILNHRSTFCLPSWPPVSRRCQHLMALLITEKSERLCSKRYLLKDATAAALKTVSSADRAAESIGQHDNFSTVTELDFARRYVFPYDAEDIKAHKFFKGLPWERLHMMPPPFIPSLRSEVDTRYFNEEDILSDTWETSQSTLDQGDNRDDFAGLAIDLTRNDTIELPIQELDKHGILDRFHPCVKQKALEWVATPYDSSRLKVIEGEIEQIVTSGLTSADREILRHFVRCYGKKAKKRPRDRLLRDDETKKVVMELRKRTAFMGYTWRRKRQTPAAADTNKGCIEDFASPRTFNRGRLWVK